MGRTVLIVEDDKSVARLLADVLEAEGYQVLTENDGEWGLRTFQHKDVDLVITDVLLPKLVGFELVEQLRALDKGKKTPVVMLSGVYRAAQHQQRMIDHLGVRAYLDKPVDLDRLLDVVRAALPLGRPSAPAPRVASMASRTLPDGRSLGRVTMRIDMAAELGISPEVDAALRIAHLPVPRRGDLAEIPFARLLGQLYSARATGALMLRKSQVKKIVYLRQGVPIFVKSNLLGECLGHIMVRERLISAQQCERSVDRLKVEKRPQGQILIDMGAISPHNLEFALERQLELKLYDLFSWLEGKYLFNDKDEHTGSAVAMSLSPAEMVFEGVRRTMSADRVNKELSRIADRIPLPASDPTFRYQALELNPRAEKLLDAIDGRTRLSELLARELLPGEQASVLLYVLVSTALLRLLDAPTLGGRPGEVEVMTLGEGDVEVLSTGEVQVDDPVLRAVAEARARARVARDRVHEPPPVPSDPELRRASMPPWPQESVRGSSPPDDDAAAAVELLPSMSPQPFAVPRDVDGRAAADLLPPPAQAAQALLGTVGVPDVVRDDTGLSMAVAGPAPGTPPASSPSFAGSLEGLMLPPRAVPPLPVDEDDVDEVAVQTERPAEHAEPPTVAVASLSLAPSVPSASDLAVPAAAAAVAPDVEVAPAPEADPAPAPSSALDVDPDPVAALDHVLPELSPAARQDIRARLEASLTAQLAARSPLGDVPPRGALASDLALPVLSAPARSPIITPASTGRALRLDLDSDKQRRLADLTTLFELLTVQDAYTRLGVEQGASSDEIAAAFEAKARVHHPDRSASASASRDLRAAAESVYLQLVRARDTLLDPAERRAYDRTLAPDDARHRVFAVATAAESKFHSGLAHLDSGDLASAYEAFADAAQAVPDEGTYAAYLAWTSFMLAPDDAEVAARALAELAAATDKSPRAEEPHVFAGLVQEKLGRREDASRSFRRALVVNPDSVRALRALRALAPPPEKKTGFLSRFGG